MQPLSPAEKTVSTWPRVLFPAALLLVNLCFVVGLFYQGSFALFGPSYPPLRLNSSPEGATAFVNGRLAGCTPLVVDGLKPGLYAVRFEKEGHAPVVHQVLLSEGGTPLTARLPETETGVLKVTIEPRDAEVLLDGELAGYTPLVLRAAPAGDHELLVRKTNFESLTQRIQVRAGETVEVAGYALRDKILAMLQHRILAEPQRVAHYMDLAHYHFANDRLDDAAREYERALMVSALPLTYPEGAGIAEQQLQQRIRNEDMRRLKSELRKKKHWPGKDVSAFRKRLDEAETRIAEDNVENWYFVEQTAEGMIRANQLQLAEHLYQRFLAQSPESPDVPNALSALLNLQIRMHHLPGIKETAERIRKQFAGRSDVLRQAANTLYSSGERSFKDAGRKEVLELAETLLRDAVQHASTGEMKALCEFELGITLSYQGRHDEAKSLFENSIAGTAHGYTQAQRKLHLASYLFDARRFDEARALLQELSSSPHDAVKEAAQILLRKLPEKPAEK